MLLTRSARSATSQTTPPTANKNIFTRKLSPLPTPSPTPSSPSPGKMHVLCDAAAESCCRRRCYDTSQTLMLCGCGGCGCVMFIITECADAQTTQTQAQTVAQTLCGEANTRRVNCRRTGFCWPAKIVVVVVVGDTARDCSHFAYLCWLAGWLAGRC